MDMTNTGDLSIEKQREFPVVDDGTWEAEYKGFKPFQEDGQWGHKEGVRLQFQITKGPFNKQYVSFKGNFFQDNQSGKWVIGRKSKLAEAIRVITGGVDTIGKAHEGTRVFVTVAKKVGKTSGKPYCMVTSVIPMPKDYAAAQAPAPQQAPAAQPAPAPQQTAPVPQPQAAAPVAAQPAPTPQKNSELLDELSDLSDFGS